MICFILKELLICGLCVFILLAVILVCYILFVAVKVFCIHIAKWRRERLDRNEYFEAIRRSYLNAEAKMLYVFDDSPLYIFSDIETTDKEDSKMSDISGANEVEKGTENVALLEECREDLFRVKNRLKLTFEDGGFPGEKLHWCRDKIEGVILMLEKVKNDLEK